VSTSLGDMPAIVTSHTPVGEIALGSEDLGRVSQLAVDADGVRAASGKAEGSADTGVVSVDPRQRRRSSA
jgi:hypothetical protein